MLRSARLGLRAQIVLALSLVFLLSFWLLGFATLQLSRRSAQVQRARAEQLLASALAAQLGAPEQRTDAALGPLCASLLARSRILGLSLTRADGSRFRCGQPPPRTAPAQRAGSARLRVGLPDPSEHATEALAKLQLFYMALTGLAVALLAYVLLTRLIVRPLERLTQSAEQLARGAEHVTVREHGSAEAMRLSRTFNEMATQLRAERTQLIERLAELERTTDALRNTQHQLIHGEKLASVGRLAAGVAHEIGNPLAAILGLLELVRSGDLDEAKQREFLTRIASETERINGIIRELLDFSRKDPERDDAQKSADLREVVLDAVNLLKPQKETKDVAIALQLAPTLRRVQGSPHRLTQVVLNLLLNAIDALGGPGCIEVSAEPSPDDSHVLLRVTDDGPGIAPEIEHRLFEPFATTKPAGGGTGLGLAVAHAIVEAAGGQIEAYNRAPGGACFEVRLRQVPASYRSSGPRPRAPSSDTLNR